MSISILLIIAITARIVSNPISNVFQKQLTGIGLHPLFVNLLSYILLTLVSLPIIVNYDLSALSVTFWLYAVLGGLFGALGNGFIIKALENGELSVLGPINSYKSVVGVIFAFILIGEIPNGYGILGIALIIFGSYYVLRKPTEHFSLKTFSQKAVIFRIAGLIFTGVEAVFDKRVIQSSDQILAFMAWCFFGSVFSYLFFIISGLSIKKELKNLDKKSIFKQILLLISTAIMIISTNYCFSKMSVGGSLALFQLSILVSIVFGYQFFGESNLWRKFIGSLIMISGSLMIILFS